MGATALLIAISLENTYILTLGDAVVKAFERIIINIEDYRDSDNP
jgi:hypothetical protein